MNTIRSRRSSYDPYISAVLVDSSSGAEPRLRTEVSLEHDEHALRVTFDFEDDGIVATLVDRDADLYTEDVLEIFLAPERPEEYFEIEVNPLGALFDARVVSPDRRRETMRVDRSWNCEGLRADISVASDGSARTMRTVVTIPFAGLGLPSPPPGTEWRGNFYRIDRSPHGTMFAAWSPTLATPPDFHRPDHFGHLLF